MRSLASRPTRHSVALPCQVVRERDFRLVADRVINLSVAGLLVTPAEPVLTGERLIVTFCAPRWNIWIDAEAVVARVIHGRRTGEYGRALGLELLRIDDWSRFVLERTLDPIPLAPPGPRAGRDATSASAASEAVRRLVRSSGGVARRSN